MHRIYNTLAILILTGTAFTPTAHAQSPTDTRTERLAPPVYADLGTFTMEISTSSPEAATYFNQGMRLYFAFNHAEAMRAFRAALDRDENCAMCWWGLAMAHGPNINMPMDPVSAAYANEYAQEAAASTGQATTLEKALIEGVTKRFADPENTDRSAYDRAWADALASIRQQWPTDATIATLYAESLMDLSPWDYWQPDGEPKPTTRIILENLEFAMAKEPDHPGANHFYIHAVEAVHPDRAVAAAERLAGLMPGAGHMVHMPGHIYIRVGRYEDAIEANMHAIHADETYIQDQGPEPGVYVLGYYPHNYDFLAFAASMIGQKEQAMGAAESLRALVPTELMNEPGMTFLQHHYTRHLQYKVRFGEWQAILDDAMPTDGALHERAMWHYARGRALAATGKPEEARAEWRQLSAIQADDALAGVKLEFNMAPAVLAIGVHVLDAAIHHAEGNAVEAVRAMELAVAAEDALTYGEPPDWTVPVRQ
ncbi:MAG: hypothetical protein RIE53_09955 [Rhodothermales bacterium]